MKKHTPGPWEWQGSMNSDVIYVGNTKSAPTGVFQGLAHCVAMLKNNKACMATKNEELRANANLIAESPKMLELLEKISHWMDESGEWWIDCPNKGGFDKEEIDAVITKAKGV